MAFSGNIILIGFSGTGKSAVGRALAQRLSRPFVDTDLLIEQSAGMTIPGIFSSLGEPAFRKMEAQAVQSAAALRGVVIAVGAGALENEKTRQSLKHAVKQPLEHPSLERCERGRSEAVEQPLTQRVKIDPVVVLLKASMETILERVRGSEERPLMSAWDPIALPARMTALLQRRMPAYLEAADTIVDSERHVGEVVDEILAFLPGRLDRLKAPSARPSGGPPVGPRASTSAGSFADPADGPHAGALGTSSERVTVDTTGGRYDVLIGRGLGECIPSALADSCGQPRRVFIVSNPVVSQLWMGGIRSNLERAGLEVDFAMIGDGEQHKSLETVSRLYDKLASNRHDRNTVIIALGGGVVGDTAGFAAATFMRGLPLVHLPTTLLAQVDSSVGGKVAVNHSRGKNLIGAFYQPSLVISDTRVLQTLPDPVFSEGMAEAIKTAVIGGEPLLRLLEESADEIASRHPAALREMVAGCVAVKAAIVSEDERDAGKRLLLNLGHTFGHALEAACGYGGVSHGEAVAVGTCMATELSQVLDLAVPDLYHRVVGLFRHFNLPVHASHLRVVPAPDEVEGYVASDKKRSHGQLRFVLPASVGDVRVVEDIPHTLVRDLIRREVGGSGKPAASGRPADSAKPAGPTRSGCPAKEEG